MPSFITFEGIEGCGKTTQIVRVSRLLEKEGQGVLLTREPGGCPISDQIRAILLDASNNKMVPIAELLLYAAARSQHIAEVIAPALSAGKHVLCDRFTDATVAYQGFGRNLDRTVIDSLNTLATGGVAPDTTILLDCPVEVGLSRATRRINSTKGDREERFELESTEFHQRVREGYLEQARKEPERFIIIDGSQSVEQTEKDIYKALSQRLRLHQD